MSDTYQKKEIAENYDFSRAMPDESLALWMGKLLENVPAADINSILDLGGGTGRFAGALQQAYACPVTVIDPSEAMLEQGRSHGIGGVNWICATAEKIPLPSGSVDMVWMSQVFHHLEDKAGALHEISRVLSSGGCLVIRNGTLETDEVLVWMKLFPEAMDIERTKIPYRADIIKTVGGQGFKLVASMEVMQRFAVSYHEYYEKIRARGLSVLISISDESFNWGLVKFKEWTEKQPQNKPVYEPVDLFVFRKN
jgi:ubiquinone/menaquinone biosynthesis C-methylase UbiE